MKPAYAILLALVLAVSCGAAEKVILRFSHPQEIVEIELLSSGSAIEYSISSPLLDFESGAKRPLMAVRRGNWMTESGGAIIVMFAGDRPAKFTRVGDVYIKGNHTWAAVRELIFDRKLAELRSGRTPRVDAALDETWTK